VESRLFLQEVAYYAANVLSFSVYVIAGCLAVSVGTEEPVLAFVLLTVGVASLGFDGILAKYSGGTATPGGFLDTIYTAVPATLLTFGSLIWLVRADYVPWWSLIVLAVLTFGPEFVYIGPRKNAGKPFTPVVLFGSLAYWVAAVCIYAELADLPAYIAPLGLYVYGLLYLKLHPERLLYFKAESDGNI
jgi:phosphatidylglycerophosphate synthase